MINYLLNRPIAVCTITFVLAILGILAMTQLPVSLLPDIAIPEITVQVNYTSASARELQKNIEQSIRNQLLQVNHINDLQSTVQDGQAVITLQFDYGTNIHLAYLETNEKIDAIMGKLPHDLERPKVVKVSAGDVPVFTLNIWQKSERNSSFLEISEFSQNVLKRRIEQLSDVALVDATGLAQSEILVQLDPIKLSTLGISERQIGELIKKASWSPSNFTVREGAYEYSIRFNTAIQSKQDIENLYLSVGGSYSSAINALLDPRVSYFADNVQQGNSATVESPRRLIKLGDIAKVNFSEQSKQGLYLFDGKRAVCMAIIKQSDAQLLHLRQELNQLLKQFQKDYPELQFAISQDQTELLDISISNLISNLLTGALLTFIMVFFFLHDFRLLLIIGIILPISFFVTFLVFYVLGISINIISLAGLVLGGGEIIDSAIIIIENIEEHRSKGKSIKASCVTGSEEIIKPLLTSVLTNSAVFLPLLLLSGIAGALFYDQALSVTIALFISLTCSYILVPVFYVLFYKEEYYKNKKETFLMRYLKSFYNSIFWISFNFRRSIMFFFALLLFGSVGIFYRMKKQGMPTISRNELEVSIDWNEPISCLENQQRINNVIADIKPLPQYVSAFIGKQQFLINHSGFQQIENESLLSIKTLSNEDYERLKLELANRIHNLFPNSIIEIHPARNLFEQLFNKNEPTFRLKLYNAQGSQSIDPTVAENINRYLSLVSQTAYRQHLTVKILSEKLILYDVEEENLIQGLNTAFNNNQISNLNYEQRQLPIVLNRDLQFNWENFFVLNRNKQSIPLSKLIHVEYTKDYKILYADKEGVFVPIDFNKVNPKILNFQNNSQELFPEVVWSMSGSYLRDQKYLSELSLIVLISITFLFCILTAQFESLRQPLIVMIIIPLGISIAFYSLYLFRDSLNILSIIGIIVLIGLLDNDSIIKIDTINREKKLLPLLESIRLSGERRLKSQIMTYLTTVLGLLPVLFGGGLGSELQRPLAISVIGGMTAGVIISWTVIPILYWFTERKKNIQKF